MAVSEQAFEKATRDVFLAHRHDCAIIQVNEKWVVAIDGGWDGNGEQFSNFDKNEAIKKALHHYGYAQEIATRLFS